MPPVLQSRKLWAAIVGLVIILVNSWINHASVDQDTVTTAVMGIVAAYCASVAWEDGKLHEAEAVMAATPITTVSTPGGSDVTVTAPPETPEPFVPPTKPVVGNMGLP